MTKAERKFMRQKQGLGAALRHLAAPVGGYGTYGETLKATLYIGRTAGLDYGGIKEGAKISKVAISRKVRSLRDLQVDEIAGTVTTTEGYYKGRPEKSVKIEIAYTGEGESPAAFVRNIKSLAQDVAGRFAQREVLVEWIEPGKPIRTDTASPEDAPSPTDKKVFCAWVRKHSTRARTRSDDACSVKTRKKRKP